MWVHGHENSGRCRLCNSEAELQLSHVLPAFLFKWLRRTSATGHMRFGEAPNRRVQDGWKYYWLCSSCEQLIGKTEKLFAERFFGPLVEGQVERLEYGPWLLKFCVSVSWRVLQLYRTQDSFDDYSIEDHKLLSRADTVWRDYLLGRQAELAAFHQHLYIVRGIASAKNGTAPNINHHVLRHIGVDLVGGEEKRMVFAKLPRLFLMGVLRDGRPDDWQGTHVNAAGGIIPLLQRVPDAFYDYVNEKASRAGDLLGSISDQQKAKVLEAIEAEPGRAMKSDTQKALNYDMALRFPRRGVNRPGSTGGSGS